MKELITELSNLPLKLDGAREVDRAAQEGSNHDDHRSRLRGINVQI